VTKWINFSKVLAKEKSVISLTELSAKITAEKSVALFCHIRPDGDTLGAALAFKLALNNLGIKAEVFCEDTVPPRFLFLSEISTVKSCLDGDYGAFIAVDCADISRLGCFAEKFLAHKNTYSIDHHISNGRFAKVNYVLETSSNCENILHLIFGLHVKPL
jgi:phosphoesterase RecJ-like protein